MKNLSAAFRVTYSMDGTGSQWGTRLFLRTTAFDENSPRSASGVSGYSNSLACL